MRAVGAETGENERFYADEVLFGGTVRNLYECMLPRELVPPAQLAKARALEPSFPSSVLYGAIKEGTMPADFSEAALCQWCEAPPCRLFCPADINVMGIMLKLGSPG